MEDLDDLLDSVLDDFKKVELSESLSKTTSESKASGKASTIQDNDRSGPSVADSVKLGQGLGLGLPALTPGKKKSGSKVSSSGESSSGSTGGGRSRSRDPERPLSATLDILQQRTRETMGNIEVADKDELLGEDLVDNLMKQFEESGDPQDMQAIIDTMMRRLLSKEVLHEPLQEIGERYPEWLAANKQNLSAEDYARYVEQSQGVQKLCHVFETTPEDFPKILDLMQNVQGCGLPPPGLVKELAPNENLDQDGLPMLANLAALGINDQSNCGVM